MTKIYIFAEKSSKNSCIINFDSHVEHRFIIHEPHDGIFRKHGKSHWFRRHGGIRHTGNDSFNGERGNAGGGRRAARGIIDRRIRNELTATAVLTSVEGRKLTFNVGASDSEGMIGEGTHVRYIVDRERFLAKTR